MVQAATATSAAEWALALIQSATSGLEPKVLVVDDVSANLRMIEAVLSDMNCELLLAESGSEALRLLREHDFAIMLLDVQMPDMDGYEVARCARADTLSRDVPILFLTAEDRDDRAVIRAYGSGAVDYLFKPIRAEVLRGKVRVFLDLYLSRREVADARDALERSNDELRQLASAQALLAEQSEQAKQALERAYNELKTTQSKLVQSAKMASLGELVAGVAHEINNPLSYSISHLSTVQRSLATVAARPESALELNGEWGRARERLQAAESGLERIRSLVVKLQTFSRLDEGACEAVNIAECTDALITLLQHRFQGRIHVQTRFRDPTVIDCDPSLVNQGLMNLVTNAIDAIDGVGAISITTGPQGDDYVIRVEDSGHGIPEEIRDRIFEPFFTTKPVGSGPGLGLSITYSIVIRHGGTIELRARPEGGTEAIVRIPMVGRRSSAHALARRAAALP